LIRAALRGARWASPGARIELASGSGSRSISQSRWTPTRVRGRARGGAATRQKKTL
jgi:hypothetical protein